MADFFKGESVLQCNETKSVQKTERGVQLEDYIAKLDGPFKLVAYFYNAVRFGRIMDGKLFFSDASGIDLDDLLELRIFSENAEHLLKRGGAAFDVRVIIDGSAEGPSVEYVDSTANIFGDCVGVADGYASLREEGRKISLTVPVDEEAAHYAIKTRAYISYDKDTMQAGFGCYRFLDIVKAERG